MTPERAVALVAKTFLIFAWLGLANTIWSLLHGHLSFDLNLFGFMVAPGLRLYDLNRYRWALRLLWVEMAFGVIVLLWMPFASDFSLQPNVYGVPIQQIPRALLVSILVVDLGITVWQLLVLRRRDVRALFHEPQNSDAVAVPLG